MNLEANGRRVVIADHDRTVLELLQIRLSLAGYDTHIERTGVAALQTIKRIRPAAVVLDLNLPELDGFGVLKALDPRSEGLSSHILLTGRTIGMDQIQEAVRLGARDCIAKPFSGQDVVERVSRLFRRTSTGAGAYAAVAAGLA